jgi:hypothetical protein
MEKGETRGLISLAQIRTDFCSNSVFLLPLSGPQPAPFIPSPMRWYSPRPVRHRNVEQLMKLRRFEMMGMRTEVIHERVSASCEGMQDTTWPPSEEETFGSAPHIAAEMVVSEGHN